MREVEGVEVHQRGGVEGATVAGQAPPGGEEEGEEVEEGAQEEENPGEEQSAVETVFEQESLHFGQELIEGGDAGVVGGFAGFGEGAGEVLWDGGW